MKVSVKAVVVLFAVVISLVLGGCSKFRKGKAANGYSKQKVVYHINNINSAFLALRNVKNHLNSLGEGNAHIIVVAHASGAYTLVDGAEDKKGRSFSATIQNLAKRGVKFQICSNTIRNKKIKKEKINLNAEIIPSGAAHLVHLQQKGYLYVKP